MVGGWHVWGVALVCCLLFFGACGVTDVERVTTASQWVLSADSRSHVEYLETDIEENMIWVQLDVETPLVLEKDVEGVEILFYSVIEMSSPLLRLTYTLESMNKLLEEEMFFAWGPCYGDLVSYGTDDLGNLVTTTAELTTMDGAWAMETTFILPGGSNSSLSFHVVLGSGATALAQGHRYGDSFATTDVYYTLEPPLAEDSTLILSLACEDDSIVISDWLRALYWRKDGCPLMSQRGGNQTFLLGSVMTGPSADIYLGAVSEASFLALGVWSSYVSASNGSRAFTIAYETVVAPDNSPTSGSASSSEGSAIFIDVLFLVMVGITLIVIVAVVLAVFGYTISMHRVSSTPEEESRAPLRVQTSEETPIVGTAGPATLRYVD